MTEIDELFSYIEKVYEDLYICIYAKIKKYEALKDKITRLIAGTKCSIIETIENFIILIPEDIKDIDELILDLTEFTFYKNGQLQAHSNFLDGFNHLKFAVFMAGYLEGIISFFDEYDNRIGYKFTDDGVYRVIYVPIDKKLGMKTLDI